MWPRSTELDADAGLTAGVLTGAGRGFCAGMDLKAFSRGEDIGPLMTFVRNGAQKPLIGAIEGFALAGGLELALTCDLLVAATGAKLGIPEAGVGLVRRRRRAAAAAEPGRLRQGDGDGDHRRSDHRRGGVPSSGWSRAWPRRATRSSGDAARRAGRP